VSSGSITYTGTLTSCLDAPVAVVVVVLNAGREGEDVARQKRRKKNQREREREFGRDARQRVEAHP